MKRRIASDPDTTRTFITRNPPHRLRFRGPRLCFVAASGSAGQIHDRRHIEMLLARVGQLPDHRLVKTAAIGRDQSQVATFERRQRTARHEAQQRRQGGLTQRLGQPGPVSQRTALVGNHPGHAHLRLEGREAFHHGRQAAGRPVAY